MPDHAAVPLAPASLSPALVETHISLLFFVGDRVYKLKKPVTLPFLDLATREARERLCHREVELNRRLAPDVYLGVADVDGPDGRPCDHLVVMRRLPEDRRLSTLIRTEPEKVVAELDALARLLASFHGAGDRSPAIDAAAEGAVVERHWRDLFDEVAQYSGNVLDHDLLAEVMARSHAYLDGRQLLFAERIARGAICDGHGDLQTDDVFCLEDGPRVLDCIEFDEQLRYVDVANDVAFLLMDLERLDAPRLGDRFLATYERAAGRALPRSLLDFYIAYRAMVRCMVSCVRVDQESGAEGEATARRARQLLDLCVRRLRSAQPVLVLVGGLPGTGKTTVAAGLGSNHDCEVVRSDVVRKELAGIAATDSAASSFGTGWYDDSVTERVYAALAERAEHGLAMGRDVVLDASFSSATVRSRMRQIALAAHATIIELRCVLEPAPADRRIRARMEEGSDASDATPAIATEMAARFEPWPEAHEIDTDAGVDVVLDRARAAASEGGMRFGVNS